VPRLEDNPEYKRAAQLAKVGPETWKSWVGALAAVASGFKELTKDAPAGTFLRQLGIGTEPTKQSPSEELERLVIDYGIPGGSQTGAVIKGLKAAIRKGKPGAQELRKVMAQEQAARGQGNAEDFFGSILRGTPYHAGRYERFPQVGEMFNPAQFKSGNLGEPIGISLTYNPTTLYGEKGSFVKKPMKWDRARDKLNDVFETRELPVETAKKVYSKYTNLRDKSASEFPFARVFPCFHGRPEDVIIKGWKGSGDEQLLKDAYTYALQQMPEVWRVRRGYNPNHITDSFPEWPTNRLTEMTDIANELVSDNNLLHAISNVLNSHEKGLAPFRFDIETIAKSNLPVSYQVALKAPEGSVGREAKRDRLKLLTQKVLDDFAMDRVPSNTPTIPDFHHLRSQLQDRDSARRVFNTHLTQYLQSKGKRGILYLPQRYDEYEIRMFEPRDVLMLDLRKVKSPEIARTTGDPGYRGTYKHGDKPTKMARRHDVLDSWEQERSRAGLGVDHSSTSLGAIYKDIDLPSLKLQPPELSHTQAQEVKTAALAHMMQANQAGLRMGQEGYSRGFKEEDLPWSSSLSKKYPKDPLHDKEKIGQQLADFLSNPDAMFSKQKDSIVAFNKDTGNLMGSYTHPNLTHLLDDDIYTSNLTKEIFAEFADDMAPIKHIDDLADFLATGKKPGFGASVMEEVPQTTIDEELKNFSDILEEGYLTDLGYILDKDKNIAVHKSGNDLFDLTTGKVHAKGTPEYTKLTAKLQPKSPAAMYNAPLTKADELDLNTPFEKAQEAFDKFQSIKIKTKPPQPKIPL
jgi:hypothetical protein